MPVNVRVFLSQPSTASVVSMTKGPRQAVKPAGERDAQAGRFRREVPSSSARYEVSVPATAAITPSLFPRTAASGAQLRVAAGFTQGRSVRILTVVREVELKFGDVNLVASRPVEHRFADPIRGELRRPVNVVPQVTVGLDTTLIIVPTATRRTQRVVARVTSGSPEPVTGTLRLRIPAGWSISPREAAFTLNGDGEQTSAAFIVTAPASRRVGRFEIGRRRGSAPRRSRRTSR